MLFTVVQKGWSAISAEWFTEDIPPVRRTGPGMGPAIIGTLVITGLASLLAVPLGILGAIYLHEYGKKGRLAAQLLLEQVERGAAVRDRSRSEILPTELIVRGSQLFVQSLKLLAGRFELLVRQAQRLAPIRRLTRLPNTRDNRIPPAAVAV